MGGIDRESDRQKLRVQGWGWVNGARVLKAVGSHENES